MAHGATLMSTLFGVQVLFGMVVHGMMDGFHGRDHGGFRVIVQRWDDQAARKKAIAQ